MSSLSGASLVDNSNGTATITWTPTSKQLGDYEVVITASDGFESSQQTMSLTVENVVNDVPTAVGLSETTIELPVQDYTPVGDLTVEDIDGPEALFEMVSGPGDRDNSLFVIYGSTVYAKAITTIGARYIRVKVSDGENYADVITLAFVDDEEDVEEDDDDSDLGEAALADVMELIDNHATALYNFQAGSADDLIGSQHINHASSATYTDDGCSY